jgi:hypothetical protein
VASLAPPDSADLPEPPGYAALVNAIDAGRTGRGRASGAWSPLRAFVLGFAAQGLLRVRIAGLLGISTQRITQLREEGCEAVLRGGLASPEADIACTAQWQRWCQRGDAAACARAQGMTASKADQPSADGLLATPPTGRA